MEVTPIKGCAYQDAEGCCLHDDNPTPECHASACPRLASFIADALDAQEAMAVAVATAKSHLVKMREERGLPGEAWDYEKAQEALAGALAMVTVCEKLADIQAGDLVVRCASGARTSVAAGPFQPRATSRSRSTGTLTQTRGICPH